MKSFIAIALIFICVVESTIALQYTHAQALAKLTAAGIPVSSSGNCSDKNKYVSCYFAFVTIEVSMFFVAQHYRHATKNCNGRFSCVMGASTSFELLFNITVI
jgi:hypothetical protein